MGYEPALASRAELSASCAVVLQAERALDESGEDDQLRGENFRLAGSLLQQPESTGVVALSLPPEMAERCAHHLQARKLSEWMCVCELTSARATDRVRSPVSE